jgi:hypothetical protein
VESGGISTPFSQHSRTCTHGSELVMSSGHVGVEEPEVAATSKSEDATLRDARSPSGALNTVAGSSTLSSEMCEERWRREIQQCNYLRCLGILLAWGLSGFCI